MEIKKVLLVEDSEPDQFYNKEIVKIFDSNIDVLQAYDGKDALEMLEGLDEPPDLILLDINMPVMDGHEFLEEYVTKEYSSSAVAMLTSSSEKKDRDACESYEIVKAYFTKPLKAQDLEKL